MNKLEKFIYDLIKKNPRLKILIRNMYQTFFDFVPDKKNYQVNNILCKPGYFFGFHDCTPFSNDDQYILANKHNIPLRMPLKNDPLTVGFWNSDFSQYTSIGDSFAWNYHKGCRLQWLDSINKIAIYNDSNTNYLISRIYDTKNNIQRSLDFPIDSTSSCGNYATSFSFYRVNSLMPGYGYIIEDGSFIDKDAPYQTGIFLIDILNNKKTLLMDLKTLSEISTDPTMKNARHFVTHSLFSPDSKYVAFLHRWIHNDVTKRYSRLIVCSLDAKEVFISPTSGMVSHYVWDDVNGLIVYCQVNGVDGHYLFVDQTLKNPHRVAPKKLNSDGHQHFIPKSQMFVTDTYPDRRRYAKIYLVNIQNNTTRKLCELKSPKKYQTPNAFQHWACDLHPRVSNNGNILCFDSVHIGERSLCFMKIN